MNWVFFAIGSAFFAGLTAILGKLGVEGINSNLATFIRTIVVLLVQRVSLAPAMNGNYHNISPQNHSPF